MLHWVFGLVNAAQTDGSYKKGRNPPSNFRTDSLNVLCVPSFGNRTQNAGGGGRTAGLHHVCQSDISTPDRRQLWSGVHTSSHTLWPDWATLSGRVVTQQLQWNDVHDRLDVLAARARDAQQQHRLSGHAPASLVVAAFGGSVLAVATGLLLV